MPVVVAKMLYVDEHACGDVDVGAFLFVSTEAAPHQEYDLEMPKIYYQVLFLAYQLKNIYQNNIPTSNCNMTYLSEKDFQQKMDLD